MKSIKDPRHNARRVALGTLFCSVFSNVEPEQCKELTLELFESTDFDNSLTEKITVGTSKHLTAVDEVIEKCAPEWPIDKIAKVDLIILRMAIFEILFDREVPDKVVIDEAVELAKEFGSDTSGKFVNGVLGTVVDIKNSINKEEVSSLN